MALATEHWLITHTGIAGERSKYLVYGQHHGGGGGGRGSQPSNKEGKHEEIWSIFRQQSY